jgi:hypothetical protein
MEVCQTFALESERESVTDATLFQRLRETVADNKPDFFLLHTGAAFRRQPLLFLSAVRKLHRQVPALRLGFERRPEFEQVCQESRLFEDSPEMHALENLLFSEVFGK